LQAYLNKMAHQLNERPREALGFETAVERFNDCLSPALMDAIATNTAKLSGALKA